MKENRDGEALDSYQKNLKCEFSIGYSRSLHESSQLE